MKKVIKHSQKDSWISYLERSFYKDFYYSWTYHDLDRTGEPLMFIYELDEDFIAFPLVKRTIPDTDRFDFSSVYGYTGPIASKAFREFSAAFMMNFKRAFLAYLKAENIVSVFSRLHPMFDQNVLMEGFGGLYENGKVVVINLMESLDIQRSRYQARWYRKIKQLKRKGYTVRQSVDDKGIKIFFEMYTENMRRVNASDCYFFSEEYFCRLLKSPEIDCRLFLIYNDENIAVSGGIMVFSQKIIQAHLLATHEEYLNDSPVKLLIDEVSIYGRAMGLQYFNLGGGVGFKEDTLFNWKAKFSDFRPEYFTWRFVVDDKAYAQILWERGIESTFSADHFPLYRLKAAQQLVNS